MADVSSSREMKRKPSAGVSASEPHPKSSKVTLLSPSLLLLEIPADANASLPVWDAMRSQQVDVTWTINPYSIDVRFAPGTRKQEKPPRRCDDASQAAKTPAPPSNVPQPQIVVQSVAQRRGASQNAGCILLTFSQNTLQAPPGPSGQMQKTPPNQTHSLIVSLPVIITQPPPAPQLCTPVGKGGSPASQAPSKYSAEPQVPAALPTPTLFHTKSSSDTDICDDSLLSVCQAGEACQMPHTRHPFHWQLRCTTSRQWVDIRPQSQATLERVYCDVSREMICLKDGDGSYMLTFDAMELEDNSKYDGVRRLSNAKSFDGNAYFPSTYQIYWWNNKSWEKYNKETSALLLRKMSEKQPECSLLIGQQEYTVDFTMMVQTNTTTGFRREVRCRPAYLSPDSMQPQLWTGIQTVRDPSGPDFSLDPLEAFSSWYPPVWSAASEQDYSLVDVPAGTQAYCSVRNLFFESLSDSAMDIVSIQQVQNLLHWDKYQRHKAYMQKQHTKSKEPLERHLFHGTTKEASEDICLNNFDPRVAGINGASCGYGCYFAMAASVSNNYSKAGPDQVRHMFLAKVLVGKMSLGRSTYRRPPPLNSKTKKYVRYDTCVDTVEKPTMFVAFDSCQCYPYYLIKYTCLPREIDI